LTAYDDQIRAQPDALRALLARPPPGALDSSRPVLLAGTGSSLHACRATAFWSGARVCEAHDLATGRVAVPVDAQVVVVSHSGGGQAGPALARARAAGAQTILVCGTGAPSPAALPADRRVETCPPERAGTHTVAYVTALAALARLFGVDVSPAVDAMEATLAEPVGIDVAQRLVRRTPVVIAGLGGDAITAMEAALKWKEGACVWSEGSSVDAALHGPPAAWRGGAQVPGMAVLSITPGAPPDAANRTEALRKLAAARGLACVTVGDRRTDELRFAPVEDERLRAIVGIVPFQRLVAEVARLTGTDPTASHTF
jgi:glucosamine--fructose-6-phosphate aminotransferase (isomerizing)